MLTTVKAQIARRLTQIDTGNAPCKVRSVCCASSTQ